VASNEGAASHLDVFRRPTSAPAGLFAPARRTDDRQAVVDPLNATDVLNEGLRKLLQVKRGDLAIQLQSSLVEPTTYMPQEEVRTVAQAGFRLVGYSVLCGNNITGDHKPRILSGPFQQKKMSLVNDGSDYCNCNAKRAQIEPGLEADG
jgi:hypothetical protein